MENASIAKMAIAGLAAFALLRKDRQDDASCDCKLPPQKVSDVASKATSSLNVPVGQLDKATSQVLNATRMQPDGSAPVLGEVSDPLSIAAEDLFPKKSGESFGEDQLGVMEIDPLTTLDGVFPDEKVTLTRNFNPSTDLRGDCALESCGKEDPFNGVMISSHHCGYRGQAANVRRTIY